MLENERKGIKEKKKEKKESVAKVSQREQNWSMDSWPVVILPSSRDTAASPSGTSELVVSFQGGGTKKSKQEPLFSHSPN